jgi:hypothetical protein
MKILSLDRNQPLRPRTCKEEEEDPSTCLEGLKNTTKELSQYSWSLGQYFNPGPPEYEAGVLIIQPRLFVFGILIATINDISLIKEIVGFCVGYKCTHVF